MSPKVWTLRQAALRYAYEPTTVLLVFLFTALATTRLLLGLSGVAPFAWWDLVAFAATVAVHPVVEWLIHVCLLHAKPFKLGRWSFDLKLAVKHRKHHYEPRDLTFVFMPPAGIRATVVAMAVLLAIHPSAYMLTWFATFAGLGLLFEWCHYICHVPYRPISRYFRTLRQRHNLHHYRNERYWWGVTSHLGDRIFGTLPKNRQDVPLRREATNLHGWHQSGQIIISGNEESRS